MPLQLLPASAQAFAPRSLPTIVLDTTVEPWLTQTLKRINRVKRPLNSIPQHFRCLTETLGGPNAIWSLASLMLPKLPDSELRKDPNPLVEALFNYQDIHIEAYIVHVDLVSQYEVAFKLTPETIEALIDYHKDIYSVDAAANTEGWPGKEAQVEKMQEQFVQAVNKFVFRTSALALEGLEEEGAGELLDGRSEEVKSAIMNLFSPLLPLPPPPPRRIADIFAPLNVTSWRVLPQQLIASPDLAPVELPKVLPSTTLSPTAVICTADSNAVDMTLQWAASTPLGQPYTLPPSDCYSRPPKFWPPPPSMLVKCGAKMAGANDFGWNQNAFAPQYATIL